MLENIRVGMNIRFKNDAAARNYGSRADANERLVDVCNSSNNRVIKVVELSRDGCAIKSVDVSGDIVSAEGRYGIIESNELEFFEEIQVPAVTASPSVDSLAYAKKVYIHFYPKADISNVTIGQIEGAINRLNNAKAKISADIASAQARLAKLEGI